MNQEEEAGTGEKKEENIQSAILNIRKLQSR